VFRYTASALLMDINRKWTFCRILFFPILIIAFSGFSPEEIYAEKLPSYREVKKILPEIWQKKYPVKPVKFISDPENKGVLTALDKRGRVYYYHFMVVIPRPVRNEDESIKNIDKRKSELWVRYRPYEKKDPWDLSFARRDLLPGKNKRWMKI